jgi:hypothetical protein
VAQIGNPQRIYNTPLHYTRLRAILVAAFNFLDLCIKSSLVLFVFYLEVVVARIQNDNYSCMPVGLKLD